MTHPSSASAARSAEPEPDTLIAGNVKILLSTGEAERARERFAGLVERHQRRASRIAYHYMRDIADADEAVQDAFVRAYVHIQSYREELSFQTWFTRILVNACLDRVKARGRRERWTIRLLDANARDRAIAARATGPALSPEQELLASERGTRLAAALTKLPGRQRTVVVLSHFEGCTPREVASITGLRESTVRVHLFRAIRNLRKLLGEPVAGSQASRRAAVAMVEPGNASA
jgi:RNA polymerase sigma-70 factor (ECF subfamily)